MMEPHVLELAAAAKELRQAQERFDKAITAYVDALKEKAQSASCATERAAAGGRMEIPEGWDV